MPDFMRRPCPLDSELLRTLKRIACFQANPLPGPVSALDTFVQLNLDLGDLSGRYGVPFLMGLGLSQAPRRFSYMMANFEFPVRIW